MTEKTRRTKTEPFLLVFSDCAQKLREYYKNRKLRQNGL